MSRGDSVLRIAHLYPTVLGLYGDRGNALVLAHRAARRSIAAEVVEIAPGDAVPRSCDVYHLGGGEDIAQTTAAELLRADGGLAAAISSGAVVLAVCAGYQILGTTFCAAGGQVPGLGVLDVETMPRAERAVGELVVDALDPALGLLTGFENHGGGTRLGRGVEPLARLVRGHGNGAGDLTEGVRHGRIVGTYLHGPALARNPALADLVLGWAVGSDLAPRDDPVVDQLRAERLARAGVQ